MLAERALRLDQRYYGLVEAIVTDVNDPQKQGRVKLTYPWFDDETISEWARVRQLYAGNGYGTFFIPEVGDEVLVAFIHGDMRLPIVLGGLYNGVDLPPSHRDDETDQKLIRTKGQHEILMDDSSGKERVQVKTSGGHKADLNDSESKVLVATSGGHQIEMDDDGGKLTASTSGGHQVEMDDNGSKMTVSTSGGHQVEMDDNGSKLTVSTSGGHQVILDDQQNTVTVETSAGQSVKLDGNGQTVTIKAAEVVIDATTGIKLGGVAAIEPLVLGTAMTMLFNTHVHTSPFLGIPTSPPLTPMTPAQVSMKVKTE